MAYWGGDKYVFCTAGPFCSLAWAVMYRRIMRSCQSAATSDCKTLLGSIPTRASSAVASFLSFGLRHYLQKTYLRKRHEWIVKIHQNRNTSTDRHRTAYRIDNMTKTTIHYDQCMEMIGRRSDFYQAGVLFGRASVQCSLVTNQSLLLPTYLYEVIYTVCLPLWRKNSWPHAPAESSITNVTCLQRFVPRGSCLLSSCTDLLRSYRASRLWFGVGHFGTLPLDSEDCILVDDEVCFFRSGTDLIIATYLIRVLNLVVGAKVFKEAHGSVVWNRIGVSEIRQECS